MNDLQPSRSFNRYVEEFGRSFVPKGHLKIAQHAMLGSANTGASPEGTAERNLGKGSIVPSGLDSIWSKPSTGVLGYFRLSLRDSGLVVLLFAVISFSTQLFAKEPVDISKLPPPANTTIDFSRDIQPIFEQSCYKCHSSERPKSRLNLTNRSAALRGGDNGVDIIPGVSSKSPLIHYVAGLVPDTEMPPTGKAPALTTQQISLLRAWIDQGANYGAEETTKPQFSVTPSIRWTAVSGDKHSFREQFWRKEGTGGGVEEFAIHEQPKDDVSVKLEGRAMSDSRDFRLKLDVQKTDVGFVRGGFDQFRKYYDDSGGFAPTLATNFFSLNRDLFVDNGRAWIDFGLTLPDKPQVVLGYEYQYRTGMESTLQWGPVGTIAPFLPNTDAKNVFPAFKEINEHTHILKLDISYDIAGWHFEDNARGEFYRLGTSREDVLADSFGAVPDTKVRIGETDHHASGANTFHVSKTVNDWLFLSGGYLYTKLDGDATLALNTLTGSNAPAFGDQWTANDIVLSRESHSGSVAGLLGPRAGLSFSSAVQADWTRQRTMGDVNQAVGNPATPPLFAVPISEAGNLDDTTVRENIALRFTKLPYTTLYAETRLQQESLNRFEDAIGGFEPFTVETDAGIQSDLYRFGFDSSPWQRVSFGASYQHSDKTTDYVHPTHFTSASPYPGFFLARDIYTDNIDAHFVYRATSWLRTTLSYRLEATDFDNATQSFPGITPGGDIFAGNYDSQTVSLNVVATPWRRLFFSSTFSFSNTRTITAQNGANYLSSWQGNVYSVLNNATYALNDSTDLMANYIFSCADFGQNNQLTGLPLGIIYDRHVVEAGLSHRFKHGISTAVKYGFYKYHEPSSGDFNDFTAHTIFATLTLMWL